MSEVAHEHYFQNLQSKYSSYQFYYKTNPTPEQLMNEDIHAYKHKDKEWTAHVKSVLSELNDIFQKETVIC